MPITPQNGDESTGANCIPAVYINKNAADVVYTPFSYIYLARHTNTSGTVVLAASASGSTAVTLDVAATGTLEVFGTIGTAPGASVTLT